MVQGRREVGDDVIWRGGDGGRGGDGQDRAGRPLRPLRGRGG